MEDERQYMRRALELSKLGASMVHPNPMVGAVIVKNGKIIGEGWHHGPGLPHAEVEAIMACQECLEGTTMYVTLEPCNHWGRTPPCTQAIIDARIAAVKIAILDSNGQVCGGGMQKLQMAGIKVEEGLCREEALEVNRSFFYHCKTGWPWIIMKTATSLDGKITSTNGESKWITAEPARRMVHRLRSEVGAVLVGSGTQLKDNPYLTNQMFEPVSRQPLKILLDSELKVSLESNLVKNSPERLIIFCTERATEVKEKTLQNLGVQVFRQKGSGRVDLKSALKYLGSRCIRSVLIEGGAEVFAGLIQENLVNEFYLFYAPFFIGGDKAKGVIGGLGLKSLGEAHRLSVDSVTRVGEDILIHAFKEEPNYCLPV